MALCFKKLELCRSRKMQKKSFVCPLEFSKWKKERRKTQDTRRLEWKMGKRLKRKTHAIKMFLRLDLQSKPYIYTYTDDIP